MTGVIRFSYNADYIPRLWWNCFSLVLIKNFNSKSLMWSVHDLYCLVKNYIWNINFIHALYHSQSVRISLLKSVKQNRVFDFPRRLRFCSDSRQPRTNPVSCRIPIAWPEYSLHVVEISGNTVMYFTYNRIVERLYKYIYQYFCLPDDRLISGIRSPDR